MQHQYRLDQQRPPKQSWSAMRWEEGQRQTPKDHWHLHGRLSSWRVLNLHECNTKSFHLSFKAALVGRAFNSPTANDCNYLNLNDTMTIVINSWHLYVPIMLEFVQLESGGIKIWQVCVMPESGCFNCATAFDAPVLPLWPTCLSSSLESTSASFLPIHFQTSSKKPHPSLRHSPPRRLILSSVFYLYQFFLIIHNLLFMA